MSNYRISQVSARDKRSNERIDALLRQEGIRRDGNLDYTCAVYDENFNIIATGSCYGNTLRCLAVSSSHQGEGLMNEVITHLVGVQHERGNTHMFLYTKAESAKFFGDLGFYRIAEVDGQLVFMENRRNGFASYLDKLRPEKRELQKVAAIVLNANPFSLGHLYLIEKAAAENDFLHLFIVSEDKSLVPFAVRKQLVMAGTAHLKNICYHDSGPYIISSATFPSYFQKDSESVTRGHALLDLTIFKDIAAALGVNRRYVGEEPNSQVTNIYNLIMKEKLPEFGIECVEVARKAIDGTVISASTIRKAIKEGDSETLKRLVPQTTLDFFTSDDAASIIQAIRDADNVIHH